MFHQFILIYNSFKECKKSEIDLEGKEVVLISSLFKLFIMMLVEELFGKVMNVCVWGGLVL